MHEMLLHENFHLLSISQLDLSPRRILIPLDFSDNSLEAIRWICNLQGLENTGVFLITVVKPIEDTFVKHRIGSTLETVQQLESESVIKLNRLSETLRSNTRLYSIGVKVLRGDPMTSIIDFAESWQADLILFSTRGQTNGNKPVVGSIARGLMDRAHCSTVSINPGFSDSFKFRWLKRKQAIAQKSESNQPNLANL